MLDISCTSVVHFRVMMGIEMGLAFWVFGSRPACMVGKAFAMADVYGNLRRTLVFGSLFDADVTHIHILCIYEAHVSWERGL